MLWLKHIQETAKTFMFQQINFTPKAWKVFLRICPAYLASTIYFNTATPLSRKKTIALWANMGSWRGQ